MSRTNKKVIIFSNSLSHFLHHLLPIAEEAVYQNYDVKLITNIDSSDKITNKKIELIPIELSRSSINPFKELMLIIKIIKIIKKENPDILHNFTIKPILYGTIAALFNKKGKIINNFLGMGYLFINSDLKMKIIRFFYSKILSIIGKFKKILYVVQNNDDKKLLLGLSVAKQNDIINMCNVGIDSTKFSILQNRNSKVVFVLLSRMLIDKGVYEFIEAAKILSKKNLNAEFWLVGSPDKQNKANIEEHILKKHHQQGYVKYLGFKKNIEQIWQQADVAVLPSYREGLSRSLLEAGAYNKAIITTDAPGGRELITDKINGLLVPAKNHVALANAMELLIMDKKLREKLATEARKHIIENYDANFLAKKTINLY